MLQKQNNSKWKLSEDEIYLVRLYEHCNFLKGPAGYVLLHRKNEEIWLRKKKEKVEGEMICCL